MPSEPGRIITFYSYKGGTGRTMALANTAWVLASNGYRVLMVDWDLEAPGLHRYFHPFLTDKTLSDTRGMIDLVFDYQRAVLALPESDVPRKLPDKWYDEQADKIFPYITELSWPQHTEADWPQPEFGELHLLPAGRQNSDYGKRVNTFNWRQLYENLGGFEFFEAMKRRLAREYDYVLVDSRTGVSDTSGISTVQMPDTLVVCFTLNAQSIEGAGEVALSVTGQRDKEYAEGKFRVLPVPTRLEKAEKEKLDLARNAARVKFDTFLSKFTPFDRDHYWGDVEMFYEPFYAYEEVLAVFADKPGAISSLLASVERITSRITDKILNLKPLPAARREEILAAYARRSAVQSDPATHAAGVFRRLGSRDEETARIVLLRLISAGPGKTAFRKAMLTDVFSEKQRMLVVRLVDEGILDRKLSPDDGNEYITIADDHLMDTWPALRGWIEDYHGQLQASDDLERRASKWDAAGRPGGLLLSTAELPDATWFKLDTELITPLAQLFIKKSREIARLRKQAALTAWIGLSVLALAFLVISYALPRINSFIILQKAITKLGPIDRQKYVWIKSGSFDMGCPSDILSGYNCAPAIHVTLTAGFWMGQTEVTNAAYRIFLGARHPDQLAARNQPGQYPVNNVGWPDAFEYCEWAGGRLPSLAEWEYAARAGNSGQLYITGNDLLQNQISLNSLHPVASFAPNGFGLFDMSGNVEEWSDDVRMYYNFASGPITDPHFSPLVVLSAGKSGPPYYWYPGVGISNMSLRGGSYDSIKRDLRLDYIDSKPFNTVDPRVGFRCVLPASDLEKVASNYQPFSALYGEYSSSYRNFYFDPYRAWWYTIYLRYMENAGAP